MEALRFEFQPRLRDNLTFMGRNGTGLCHGVSITLIKENWPRLILAPINSKGDISPSCNFDIPRDPNVLRELGKALLDLADTFQISENTLGVSENANGC